MKIFELSSKLTLFSFFIVYLIVLNFFSESLPQPKEQDLIAKEQISLSDACIIFIGGSNVMHAVNAENLSSEDCGVFNLGVAGETSTFSMYLNWLKKLNLKPSFIIYSSVEIINEELINNKNCLFYCSSNNISIASQISSFFISGLEAYKNIYNSFGDKKRFICLKDFSHRNFQESSFKNNSNEIINSISDRVSKIQDTFKGSKIYLRIPEFYLKKKDFFIFKDMMTIRKNNLEEKGHVFINEISEDLNSKEYFCDATHLNEKGRAFITKNLKNSLIDIL